MATCPFCHMEVADGAEFCKSCGWRMDAPLPERREPTTTEPVQIPPTPYVPVAQPRGGMPWWAIVLIILAVSCVPCSILSAILLPALTKAREKAVQTACLSNLKQVSTAVLVYAESNDGLLPPGSEWCDAIEPYVGKRTPYICPKEPGNSCGYGWAEELSGETLSGVMDPAMVAMLYDSEMGWNGARAAPYPFAFRHSDGANVTFLDGHAKWVTEAESRSLGAPETFGTPAPEGPDGVWTEEDAE